MCRRPARAGRTAPLISSSVRDSVWPISSLPYLAHCVTETADYDTTDVSAKPDQNKPIINEHLQEASQFNCAMIAIGSVTITVESSTNGVKQH